ncbi:MAG: hypothetical protein FJ225_06045 [Lentisphaerae bacterium]|nr:hypothetical protein [Lentisphaerota bacterium]
MSAKKAGTPGGHLWKEAKGVGDDLLQSQAPVRMHYRGFVRSCPAAGRRCCGGAGGGYGRGRGGRRGNGSRGRGGGRAPARPADRERVGCPARRLERDGEVRRLVDQFLALRKFL